MSKIGSLKSQERVAKAQWNKRYKKHPYRKVKPKTAVRDFFKKYEKDSKSRKVLDLGCGNGRNLRYIASLGYKTYGIDISEIAIKQLEETLKAKKLRAHLSKGSFYDLPYKDKFFDSIVSINVLQHNDWKGTEKSFAEASRVLKDNGLFLLSIRSTNRTLPKERKNIHDRGITFIPRKGTKAGIMLHHYSRAEIKELASRNLFKILSIKEVTKDFKGKWIVIFKKLSRSSNKYNI